MMNGEVRLERCSGVAGLPVVCMDTVKKLGIVSDIVFDMKSREVKAFLLERKGYRIGKRAILMEDVLSLGKDALIINDSTCITPLKKLEESEGFKDKGDIRGLKVYSRRGSDLGIVKDILFDCTTGKIEGIEISDGLLQDVMNGRNILPLFGKVEFGEENILVDNEAIEEIMNTGGGIKKKIFGEKDMKLFGKE